ncbi:hypothetical protein EG327_002127 [Venturia inaequalis]|uniref:Uncharacterized protein n=1 Tax=Venturia inaequalis TaxID=5025 RepID=A0A8H3VL11_VENIN|nr:hypothetical protein EG327_002127 [Venturia inaequalis]
MYYDLNVPWTSREADLQRKISFLADRYNVLALSHTLSGKFPVDITCPIPATLTFAVPPSVQILRRLTLVIQDSSQNHRIKDLTSSSSGYDILAVRPTDEKTLQHACGSLDCDIISLDLTIRYPFHFKYKMFSQAIERGVRIELCYGPGIAAFDSTSRQRVIENATALIKITRGRGLIISSDAANVLSCRGPADIVNLAAIWGLGQERGMEAVTKEARSCAVAARIKRTSYRGVIDVIYGGEKPLKESAPTKQEKNQAKGKRKAAEMTVEPDKDNTDKPLSKRQMKKIAAEARKANSGNKEADDGQGKIQNGTQMDVDTTTKP